MKTQPIIKNENLKAVYQTVCRRGAISRAGLSRALRLSKPTISLLVEELIREGFLIESADPGEQTTRTGRRPVCLIAKEGVRMIAVAHWKMDGCWMDLILHAEKGEQWADEAISEIADNFAKTVRNLITLFCPELIIIGGDGTILGQRFMDRAEENLNRLDYLFMASKVRTVYGGPTDPLVDIGAAGYMIDHYISLADPYRPGLYIG